MKHLRLLTFITAWLFTSSSALSQGLTQRIANNYFVNMEYKNAIKMYEELLKKNNKNGEARINLAESYRRINDIKNSVRVYAVLAHAETPAPQNIWQYAQVLAMDEQYAESANWYRRYAELVPEDNLWAKRFAKALDNPAQFFKDSAQYKAKFAASLNSWQADFSPMYFKNGLVFVSARKQDHRIKHVSMYDQTAFTDLYFAQDTSSIATEIESEQLYYSVDMHRDSYGNLSNETSNDSDAPAQYGSTFLFDSMRYHYTKLTSINHIGPMSQKFHEGPFSYFKGKDSVIVTRSAPYVDGGPYGKSISQQALYMVIIHEHRNDRGRYLPFNDPRFSSGHPAWTMDYKTLYFISNRPGGKGGTDLYTVQYDNGVWSSPVNVEELNTPGNEMFPYVDAAGTLYFASDGRPGLGGLDIFQANKVNGEWAVKNMGNPFNSSKDDFGIIFSPNLKKGFFSSNRKRGFDDDDIYSFKKLCEGITVFAYDSITNVPLDSVMIMAGEEKGITDKEGKVSFCMVPADIPFTAAKDTYEDRAVVSDRKEIRMPLHPLQFDLSGVVRSEEDKKPMSGVNVKLLDEAGSILKEFSTQKDGAYKFPLDLNSNYKVLVSKENCGTNYIGKSTEGLKKSEHLRADLTLICKGDIIRVENIYYDLNKYAIRPDAEPELNKLADLMWKYPDMRIELRSHTDSRGSTASNMSLSAHRAQAAVDYLISKGIIPSRLRAAGYGESLPLNKCKDGVKCTEEEFQLNRRTEFKVLSIK